MTLKEGPLATEGIGNADEGTKAMGPLSATDVERLFAVPAGRGTAAVRNRAMLAVLAGAGIAVSELLALTVADVEPAGSAIEVRGDRSRRVELSPARAPDLAAWLAIRSASPFAPEEPLFCTGAGDPIEPSYLRRLLARLGRRAGVDALVSARALREAFIADRVSAGATPAQIAAELGHTSPASTRRIVRALALGAGGNAAGDARMTARLLEELVSMAHCGLAVVRARRGATGQIADFAFDYVNPAAAALIGASRAELEQRSVAERMPEAVANGTFTAWRRLIEDGEGGGREGRSVDVGGRAIWFGVRRRAVGDRVVLSIEDLGALRTARRAQSTAEDSRTAIMDAVPDGVLLLDAAGGVRLANEGAARILGVPHGGLAGRTLSDPRWGWSRPDAGGIPGHPAAPTAESGLPVHGETFAVRRADGLRVLVSVSAAALLSGGGPPYAVAVALSDLTARRQLSERARAANAAAALVAGECDALLVRTAPDGRILDASGASAELLGCEPHELLGRRFDEWVVIEDRQELRRADLAAMERRDVVRLRHRVEDRSARVRWVVRATRASRDPLAGAVDELHSVVRAAPPGP